MRQNGKKVKARVTVRGFILPLLVVFAITGAYLFQRHMSLELVWRQSRQEAEQRVMVEDRDRLHAELQRLTGYERLNEIWVANGRPAAPEVAQAGPVEDGPQEVAEVVRIAEGRN